MEAAVQCSDGIQPTTHMDSFHFDSASSMRYRLLGKTGLQVSVLSFGSVFRETREEESIQVVHHALKSGINYIDTAPWYGHGKSEMVLGKALQGIPRDAYILSTKVGRYLPEVDKMFDFSAERVLKSVDESLARLGLDYVDIIQVHDMEFAQSLDIIVKETLPALLKVKEQGKARFIGITGYPLENFRKVINSSQVPIDTVLTYCHCSMNDVSLLEYLQYFKEQGVGVINASPISMGLLSDRGPPDWHPANENTREKCREAALYCKSQGVDISKLAMHFSLSKEGIPTTLVSTASLENLQKNIDIVRQAALTDKEKDVLSYVMNNIFLPAGNLSWEGVEVDRYRDALQNLHNSKN
ncbi:L-galactose dehydrogenase isoform X2 [Nematostella vectensis]|uniref:L-galactose dehydrogenase isoform X2 n=1 Tax=Nematostella vectensis TaxID=45351 RepID=UPI00207732D6|nr:L-galactose dehydrogenase isoform X2 [Nematostella vectensis]